MTEESLTPHPLFGAISNFEDFQPSNSNAESDLIRSRLNLLNGQLNAISILESVCRFLWGIRDFSNSRIDTYKYILEKLLLWCFYVRKKDLAELVDADVVDFQFFCLSPPEGWIRDARRTKRFEHFSGCVSFNKSWRPFVASWKVTRIALRKVLVKIIRDLLPNVTVRSLLPSEDAPAKNGELASADNIIEAAEEYLNYLYCMRSPRGSHEIKLFLFACASYLKLDVRAFNEIRGQLFLNKLRPTPDGGFFWSVDMPQGQINYILPDGFRKFYERYINTIHYNEEELRANDTLAFQRTTRSSVISNTTIACWIREIPAHPTIKIPPNKILKLLSANSKVKSEIHDDLILIASKLCGKRKYAKFIARLDGLNISSFLSKETAEGSLESECSPFPLLWWTESNGEPYISFNYLMVRKVLACFSPHLTKGYIESLRVLLWSAYNGPDEGRLSDHTKAYEILILWTLLVRRKPLNMLADEDAVSFFWFCCYPPASWVARRTRYGQRGCDPDHSNYNQNWRPFRPAQYCPRGRGARIITRCSNILCRAIKHNFQGANVFAGVLSRLLKSSLFPN
ncbi:hypothetical protein [Pseudomonas sp. A014]|uniref:hypothetical protein n=1 Tax=Pseudomonas sp. A014 TaxID=3458058 RepID=UPI004035A85A